MADLLCFDGDPHPAHQWGGGSRRSRCPGRTVALPPAPPPVPRPPVPPPPPPAPEQAPVTVPVVDLTGLCADLRATAATRRHDAEAVLTAVQQLAESYEREAGYLEDLARILGGTGG